jgi:hypothetical protein
MKTKIISAVFAISLTFMILSNASVSFAGFVGGTVTGSSAGSPVLSNVLVEVFDSTGALVDSQFTMGDGTYLTTVDLPAGNYRVYADPSAASPTGYLAQYYNNKSTLASADLVAVPASGTATVNISLPLGGTITGTVKIGSMGLPVSGILVEANDFTAGSYGFTTTNPDGTYAISGLPAGSYTIQVYYSLEYVPNYYNNTSDLTLATSIPVTLGSTTPGIDFSLIKSVQLDQKYDFDGNGTKDILWRWTNGQTYIWLMNGTSVLSHGFTTLSAGPEWDIVNVGDFDGDGKGDILWRRKTDGLTYIWFMNGLTVASHGFTTVQAGTEWNIEGVGDFNGDGKCDILWRRSTDGATYIWLMNGLSPSSHGLTSLAGGLDWTVKGIGDFNGDGKSDILWRWTDGSTFIWLMNGTTASSYGFTSIFAGLDWEVEGVGDFNGDSKSDILWKSTTGETFIWLMNGINPSSYGFTSLTAGLDWQIRSVGDYNNDGKADILWRSLADSTTYIWLMNGMTVSSHGFTSVNATLDWEMH